MSEIRGQYLESEHFKKLISRFKKDKKVKILKDEIAQFIESKRIVESELENALTSIIIMWAVKTNNLKVLKHVKNLALSKDATKINKSLTSEFGNNIVKAIQKMNNNKRAVREVLKSDVLDFFDHVIDDVEAYFYENFGAGKEQKEREEKMKALAKKYSNDQIKKVGINFENNPSVVMLMSLINKANQEEITTVMVNRAIAAGYIVLATKVPKISSKIEKNIHFNKINIDDLQERIGNSISHEVLEDSISRYKLFQGKLEDYEDIPEEVFSELEYLIKETKKLLEKEVKSQAKYDKIKDV